MRSLRVSTCLIINACVPVELDVNVTFCDTSRSYLLYNSTVFASSTFTK